MKATKARRVALAFAALLALLAATLFQLPRMAVADPVGEGDPETITLTLHASGPEGDFADPIVLEVAKGSTYNQALATKGWDTNSYPFQKDGYVIMGNKIAGHLSVPMSEIHSNQDFVNNRLNGSTVLNEDTDAYIPYRMAFNKEIAIEAPLCGTSSPEAGPQVTVKGDAPWFVSSEGNWCQGASNPGSWSGTFEPSNTYYAFLIFHVAYGYMPTYNVDEISVEGGTLEKIWQVDDHSTAYGNKFIIIVSVKADHDWQFKGITWGADNASATADYVCAANEEHTDSVACTVDKNEDPGKTVYTATVSAEDSLDGVEHGDEKTVYAVYNLYVQGVHVTGENCDDIPVTSGKVSFDPESNTLTLDNATIEMSRRNYGFSSDKQEYGIRSNLGTMDNLPGSVVTRGPVTINLIGENKIVNDEIDAETTDKMGIYVASAPSVTYTGEGSLSISMTADESGKKYYGIRQRQNISFDGVTVNVDIDGTAGTTNGMYLENSNTASLTGGAEMHINVGNGYAMDSNGQNNEDLSVEEGCVFEAISGGGNGALHGDNWIQLTGDTKALGVLVNTEPTPTGRSEWDGTTSFAKYKYVRIPGVKSVTVNYDLGEGHEALAQAEALRDAINGRYAMQVLEVNGSVVTIRVPELSDNDTKNTVDRLLGALRAALNESVGHDPHYGPYWVYDQNEWNFNNALKTIDNYNSYDEVLTEREQLEQAGTMPEEGQTIYALWAKPISEVAVNVESPVCGTEVTADLEDPEDPEMGYDPLTQKPQPVVSISTDHVSVNTDEDGWENTWWVDPTNKEEDWFTILPPCYTGTMVGDEDYMLVVAAEADFGYYIARDATYTTSNGTVDTKLSHSFDKFADIYITVTADHEWGEWEVVKEPTVSEPGEEQRTCKHCDETKTRDIPAKDAETFVLTFKLNGGTMDGKTEVVYRGYKEGVTIRMPEPTRAGYRFLYWEGSKYYAGQSYKITEDHTFTAVWEKLPTPAPKTGPKVPSTGDPTTLAWAGVMVAGAVSTLLGRAARRRED